MPSSWERGYPDLPVCFAWRMSWKTAAATRGIRPLRKHACALWRGDATAPPDRTWSSSWYGTRGSYSASGGWVEMCASACSNALLLEKFCVEQTLSISEQSGCGNLQNHVVVVSQFEARGISIAGADYSVRAPN